LSVPALIDQYGKSVTVERATYTRSTSGGPEISSTAQTSVVMLLQVGGGGSSRRYGADRGAYDAVGYVEDGTDVREGDFVLYADGVGTRRYRVESSRIPDERASGDSLAYVIVDLSEDRPRT
jgi:hypothetical protein